MRGFGLVEFGDLVISNAGASWIGIAIRTDAVLTAIGSQEFVIGGNIPIPIESSFSKGGIEGLTLKILCFGDRTDRTEDYCFELSHFFRGRG